MNGKWPWIWKVLNVIYLKLTPRYYSAESEKITRSVAQQKIEAGTWNYRKDPSKVVSIKSNVEKT
jgi:hypothetical protein